MEMEQSVPKRRHIKFGCRVIISGVNLTPPMKMEQSVSKRRHIKFRCRGIISGVKLTPPMEMEQSVPKRRHIKFRCRGIIGVVKLTPPMKMEECFETSAYKIQMPGNRPKEGTQHSEQGESLKSRTHMLLSFAYIYTRFQ
jgi:hypothetical protein